MDVVLYNFALNKLEIVSEDKWNTSSYPKFNNTSVPENSTSGFYPVGVVVIPGSHGVLKDGSGKKNQCGIMSLVPMNYNTPENGSTLNQYISWGGYGTDVSEKSDGLERFDSVTNGLTNYTEVNQVGSSDIVYEKIQGTTTNAYLPSDAFSTVKNPYDDKTWYMYNGGSYYVPSPYKNDGLYNPIYNQTASPASEYNALSDFKGIVNTKIITDLATSQSNWRTASAITLNSGAGYYPAACCCSRYKTVGTKAFVDCSVDELKNGTGFWYLPAAGELGYVVVRRVAIGSTISKLNTAYGVGATIGGSGAYGSSSEYSNYYSWHVATNSGNVNSINKDSGDFVRAFMRL